MIIAKYLVLVYFSLRGIIRMFCKVVLSILIACMNNMLQLCMGTHTTHTQAFVNYARKFALSGFRNFQKFPLLCLMVVNVYIIQLQLRL